MSGPPSSLTRRAALACLTGLMAGRAQARPETAARVSLAGIAAGRAKVVTRQSARVIIRHRTGTEIEAMRQADPPSRDPARDQDRVQNPAWLIIDGHCTHAGCPVWPLQSSAYAFRCFCHGSIYDVSGRILRGPAPRNLLVPDYRFDGPDHILFTDP